LNHLVGQHFRVGAAVLFGGRLIFPCKYLEKLLDLLVYCRCIIDLASIAGSRKAASSAAAIRLNRLTIARPCAVLLTVRYELARIAPRASVCAYSHGLHQE
jgi:hypothetical protein